MLVQVFIISFLISLFGTIPPATINITVMQLSLKDRRREAISLSIGAVLLDTTYAALAVLLQKYLASQIEFTNFFYLIAAIVLFVLGVLALISKASRVELDVSSQRNLGFLKGVTLGLLNPLAMPFWLATTSYLKLNGLINLEGINFWSYVTGAGLGELAMLLIIIKIGSRFTRVAENRSIVQTIPGIAFLLLGIVNLIQWSLFYF